MIRLTRLNGSQAYINADMILFVETTPDTVVSLVSGERVVVKETAEDVVEAVVAYRRRLYAFQLDCAETARDALCEPQGNDGTLPGRPA